MARISIAALATLAVALLVGGCGDDAEGGGPPSAYEKQKAAYIEETDGYCRRLTRRIHEEVQPYLDRATDSPRASAEYVRFLKPRLEFEFRRVRSIVLPNRDVNTVLRFLDVWGEVMDRAERNPVAFVRAERPFAEPEELARRYGFQVCGSF